MLSVQNPALTTELAQIDERSDRYRMRMARNARDVDAVLKLRFDVFNLELGEGLDSAYAQMRDRDRFDAHCHHLLVEDLASGAVIGTYRLIPFDVAEESGFYSADEFCLDEFPMHVVEQSIELGRACIAAAHRNTRVLYLLWLGLARYMQATQSRYFFGCCSLTSQSPADGYAVAEYLEAGGYRSDKFTVSVQPEYQLPSAAATAPARARVPKLMRLYLQYGARIVSEPAIDRRFKTIDYLALLDIEALDSRSRRMFGLETQA
ncbi:MAG: GNAT family N-acyltransferase [Pseudomonadota bacterium]